MPSSTLDIRVVAILVCGLFLVTPGHGRFIPNPTVESCDQPVNGQKPAPSVLNGFPVMLESGTHGLPRGDIILSFFLPLHKRSVRQPVHRCEEVDVQQAVPMTEAMAFAFELLTAGHDPGRQLNFLLGYRLRDTCTSVPVALNYLEDAWRVTDEDKAKYDDVKRKCPRCLCEDGIPEATTPECPLSSAASGDLGPDNTGDYAGQFSSGKGDADDSCTASSPAKRSASANLVRPNVLVGPLTQRLVSIVTAMLPLRTPRHFHVSPAPLIEAHEQADPFSFAASASYRTLIASLLAICKREKWTHLSLIVSEDDHNLNLKSILESEAATAGVCLAVECRITTTDARADNISLVKFFQRLRQTPASLTTVLVLADEDSTVNIWNVLGDAAANSDLMGNASRGVLDWQWIGLQDWEFVAKKAVHLQTIVDGAPPLALRVVPELWAPLPSNHTWASIRQLFKARLEQLKPTPEVLLRSPWLAPVWEKVNRCHLPCRLAYDASNATTRCCDEPFNPDFPHVVFGGRRNRTAWRNCTGLNNGPVVSNFLLDRSLQVMNTVFAMANVTRSLVREAIDKCQQGWFRDENPTACGDLGSFDKEIPLAKQHANVAASLEAVLSPRNYNRHLKDLARNGFTGNREDGSGQPAKAGSKEAIEQQDASAASRPVAIEKLLWLEDSWRMTSIGKVLELSSGQTVAFDSETAIQNLSQKSTCPNRCSGGYRVQQRDHYRRCCILCERCSPGTISGSTPDSCQHCPHSTRPNNKQTECTPYPLVYPGTSDSGPALILCLSLVGTVAVILTFAAFHRNRNMAIVKSADTALSTALLATLLASFLCVNVLILKPTDTTCVLQMALALIWPVVYVSGLAIKTNRLRVVFRQTNRLSQAHLRLLSNEVQLLTLVSVFAITSCYFVAWGLLAPPTAVVVNRSVTRNLVCKFSAAWMGGYFGWTLALIAVTSALAYFTRHLPGFFNEAAYHFLAGALILACWIILVPAYYFSQQVPPSIILAAIVLAQGYSIFGALFLRRLYYLHTPPENTDSQFMSSTSGAAQGHGTHSSSVASNGCNASGGKMASE